MDGISKTIPLVLVEWFYHASKSRLHLFFNLIKFQDSERGTRALQTLVFFNLQTYVMIEI